MSDNNNSVHENYPVTGNIYSMYPHNLNFASPMILFEIMHSWG